MKTFITGNSHTIALAKGSKTLGLEHDEIQVFPWGSGAFETKNFYKRENNKISFIPETLERYFVKFTGSPFINQEYRWGFCIGSHSARVYKRPFWRNSEPAEICHPEKRPITIDVLDACIENDLRHIFSFLSAVKSAEVNSFVITCPPPRSDSLVIQNGTRREVVSYIDKRMRLLLANFLKQIGIRFVSYPTKIEDSYGLLKDEYFSEPLQSGKKDPHHANNKYGRLVMHNVVRHLENE